MSSSGSCEGIEGLEFAVQANLLRQVKQSGRSYKRESEKEKDWQREKQRLMRNKV